MLNIHSIQSVPLQRGDGRNLRYVLQLQEPLENDPFLILADDKFAHNTFADHPHKGIQTVTHVLEGSLTHYDSQTGTGGQLSAGDFQIMTAGRGIIHNENPARGEEVRVLQLWVNLSPEHKKEAGNYQDLLAKDVPSRTIENGTLTVYAGDVDGVKSPLTLLTPFTYATVTLEKGGRYTFPVNANYNTYLYGLDGDFRLNENENLHAFDTVHFETSDTANSIVIEALENTTVAIFSGEPIKAPVVAQGPFVMNTQQEIYDAFESYRNGTFLEGKAY